MSDEQKTPDEPQRARLPEPEQFTGDPCGAGDGPQEVPPLISTRINAARAARTIT